MKKIVHSYVEEERRKVEYNGFSSFFFNGFKLSFHNLAQLPEDQHLKSMAIRSCNAIFVSKTKFIADINIFIFFINYFTKIQIIKTGCRFSQFLQFIELLYSPVSSILQNPRRYELIKSLFFTKKILQNCLYFSIHPRKVISNYV